PALEREQQLRVVDVVRDLLEVDLHRRPRVLAHDRLRGHVHVLRFHPELIGIGDGDRPGEPFCLARRSAALLRGRRARHHDRGGAGDLEERSPRVSRHRMPSFSTGRISAAHSTPGPLSAAQRQGATRGSRLSCGDRVARGGRSMTVTQAEIDKVVAESKRVLLGNHHSGISAWDGKLYECTYPSPTSYPFQWFWDSAFISIALLHVDPALAKREITCLLQGVQPDGFMPHMLLWEKSSYLHWLEDEYSIRLAHPFYTGTTQPPVV